MASVIFFCTKSQWEFLGVNPKYPVRFKESVGAVIAKGNIIEGITAKE